MTKFADIKGFVFDLDGVITDTSVLHGNAWHQLANDLRVTWTKELADGLKGISRMDSLEMILKAGRIENNYTPAQKEALATKKNTNYVAEVDKMTPANILPGMQAFLDDLRAKGYKLSLASASKNAPRVLDKLGLTDYFPEIVDPASLTHGKPDPEIYTKGAQLLNLDPAQCIGLEDAAAGVQAINAAGETSLGIGDASELSAADMVFADTAQVTLANIQQHLD
ncbi:beta-phosphoglucomutase [Levilactobacillus suantsaii]|uniref:Beta-phosphoglucomutase n=1 Tax=Levilactobacillus suantsaii TaxID=2292255 RepID=A0A4Q0VGV8_9LACO|nr:beta-phosphoglucomutase [Levilactobacillus suantsaii]QMU07344.1 beta-phosphoglucomutase [Levilactobacillus suantsaii]RXI76790.1 beta-phosphoglucomutase [Levilactobacillus suantsaii]